MLYEKPLPPVRKLKKLAEWDGPFPMKSYRIVIGAMRYGFDEDVIEFLQLFPRDKVFKNRNEFVRDCEVMQRDIITNREQSDLSKNIPAPKQSLFHTALKTIANATAALTANNETWYRY